MNHIRHSLIGRCLNFFAMLAFLVLQVPGAAFAESGTKVTHEAIKFFVPEKRIRLDAAVVDPKGVTTVRAYFKSKTQADYVFVPMESQQTSKGSYVANLPAMAKSNTEIQYLFLVVNGANEVLKTEPFVVKAKDSTEVPSWQMVSGDESVQLFTEVPDAPAVAASFSDSVSLNVVESGARFGLVAQLYGTSGSATASGAAVGATNAGTAAVATAGLSTVTIVAAAAGLVGVAAAGGSKGGGSSSATPTPTPTPTPIPLSPLTKTFTGSWNWAGNVPLNGCPANDGGAMTMTLMQGGGGSFSGTVTASGIQSMSLNNGLCSIASTNALSGSVTGTIVGNNVSFSSIDLSSTANPFVLQGNGAFLNGVLSATITRITSGLGTPGAGSITLR